MCIYPHGSRVFMIARALILLSLAARLTIVSLDAYLTSNSYLPPCGLTSCYAHPKLVILIEDIHTSTDTTSDMQMNT